jgi:hypothetical protein
MFVAHMNRLHGVAAKQWRSAAGGASGAFWLQQVFGQLEALTAHPIAARIPGPTVPTPSASLRCLICSAAQRRLHARLGDKCGASVSASHQTTLDGKAAGWPLPSGGHFLYFWHSRDDGVDGLLDQRVALISLRSLGVFTEI